MGLNTGGLNDKGLNGTLPAANVIAVGQGALNTQPLNEGALNSPFSQATAQDTGASVFSVFDFPVPTGSGRTGSVFAEALTFTLTGSGQVSPGTYLYQPLPELTLSGFIAASPTTQAHMSLSPLQATGRVGLQLNQALPRLGLVAQATIDPVLWGAWVLPPLMGQGRILSGSNLTGALDFNLNFEGAGQMGSRGQGELPRLRIQGQTLVGSSLSGAIVIPALRVSGQLQSVQGLQGAWTLPALQRLGSGIQNIQGLILPALQGQGRISSLRTGATAYSTNLKHGETTQYIEYAYTHLVRFRGRYYGVGALGLYEMGASSQIKARIKLTPMDFGTFHHKRVPYAYIGCPTPVTVRPYYDNRQAGEYQSAWDAERVRLSRGNRSRYFSLEIESTQSDFRIERMELYVEKLGRKTGRRHAA